MGALLEKSYHEHLEDDTLIETVEDNKTEEIVAEEEEQRVQEILNESIVEYNNMQSKTKFPIKTMLLIVGTLILIALVGKTLFSLAASSSRYSENKRVTSEIKINENN